jgi:hypothetical protein
MPLLRDKVSNRIAASLNSVVCDWDPKRCIDEKASREFITAFVDGEPFELAI